jgi:Rrf2 family protein
LAEALRVPPAYLPKILRRLAEANIISLRRGRHGGYTLKRSADGITLLELVEAVEGPVAAHFDFPAGASQSRGRAIRRLARTYKSIGLNAKAELARTTLQELL